MKRKDCLEKLVARVPEDTIMVANLGNTSTLLMELRPSDANLYPMNLGCCTGVGLGVAMALPHRKVIVLDGDGNLLLNLSALPDLANENPGNLAIIVFDNECYEASGAQPTATAGAADLEVIARGSGIKNSRTVRDLKELDRAIGDILTASEPVFVVAKVERDGEAIHMPFGHNATEIKFRFVRYIEGTEKINIIPKARGARIDLT